MTFNTPAKSDNVRIPTTPPGFRPVLHANGDCHGTTTATATAKANAAGQPQTTVLEPLANDKRLMSHGFLDLRNPRQVPLAQVMAASWVKTAKNA